MFGSLGPAELVIALLAVMLPSAMIGGVIYGVVRLVRGGHRSGATVTEVAELLARVERLEGELDAVHRTVERLEAAQEFTSRLLDAPAPSSDRTC